jgi:hypothetical protein
VSEEPKIDGWWTYLKAVLFRPIWEFLTVGALFTFLFVATWWRDNFASSEWKERLELKVLLPHWHPAIWLCVCLLVLWFVALRHAFHLWQEQQVALGEYRVKPIPEFVVDIAKEGEEVVGFKIRNTSSRNLYSVGIANMQTRIGEVWWHESFFPCLDARIGEKVLKPCSVSGQWARFHNMPTLLITFQNAPESDNPEHVGDIVVFARDADGIGYRFSTSLQLWNLHTWRVWDTARVLAKPSTGVTGY